MNLTRELQLLFPENKLKLSLIDRYAFAGDAGFYYLLPQAVVQPETLADIQSLFQIAGKLKIPLTFRAGGTSLSGQSISDGILVDISKHWKQILPSASGDLIKVQPAAIGAHVNWRLQPFSKKIGPDPASISAAMMGGILSNNSSGMCCGVAYNSYHTLKTIHFILPNGHEYDTSLQPDYERFEQSEPSLFNGILHLKKTIEENIALVVKIRNKYKSLHRA